MRLNRPQGIAIVATSFAVAFAAVLLFSPDPSGPDAKSVKGETTQLETAPGPLLEMRSDPAPGAAPSSGSDDLCERVSTILARSVSASDGIRRLEQALATSARRDEVWGCLDNEWRARVMAEGACSLVPPDVPEGSITSLLQLDSFARNTVVSAPDSARCAELWGRLLSGLEPAQASDMLARLLTAWAAPASLQNFSNEHPMISSLLRALRKRFPERTGGAYFQILLGSWDVMPRSYESVRAKYHLIRSAAIDLDVVGAREFLVDAFLREPGSDADSLSSHALFQEFGTAMVELASRNGHDPRQTLIAYLERESTPVKGAAYWAALTMHLVKSGQRDRSESWSESERYAAARWLQDLRHEGAGGDSRARYEYSQALMRGSRLDQATFINESEALLAAHERGETTVQFDREARRAIAWGVFNGWQGATASEQESLARLLRRIVFSSADPQPVLDVFLGSLAPDVSAEILVESFSNSLDRLVGAARAEDYRSRVRRRPK